MGMVQVGFCHVFSKLVDRFLVCTKVCLRQYEEVVLFYFSFYSSYFPSSWLGSFPASDVPCHASEMLRFRPGGLLVMSGICLIHLCGGVRWRSIVPFFCHLLGVIVGSGVAVSEYARALFLKVVLLGG